MGGGYGIPKRVQIIWDFGEKVTRIPLCLNVERTQMRRNLRKHEGPKEGKGLGLEILGGRKLKKCQIPMDGKRFGGENDPFRSGRWKPSSPSYKTVRKPN